MRVAVPAELHELVARQSRPWQERQQARVVIVGPTAEADLVVIAPSDLPRLVTDNRVRPLPSSHTARGSSLDWPGILPHFRESLLSWENVTYAVPLVGEAPVCLYRADLFADPAHQKGYRTFQTGQLAPGQRPLDLRPPVSWDELALQAEYFRDHRSKGMPSPSMPPLPRAERDLDRLFHSIASSYVRRAIRVDEPLAASNREELFAFHYDLAAGQPRIATPGFVAALRLMQRLQACRPPEPADQPAQALLDGKAVLCIADAGLAWRAQQVPALRDRIGICPLPGADRYYTAAGKEVSLKDTVNRVPYLGGAGWLMAVAQPARQADAAGDLLEDLASPARGMQVALSPELGGGATRIDQVLRDRWGAFGLDVPRTIALKDAVSRALYQHGLKGPVIVLRTPDQAAARQALTTELRAALTSRGDAQAALERVRQQWHKQIQQRGAERHAADYRRSLGLLSK